MFVLSINAFSEQMFAFDSKILPSKLLRDNTLSGYIGADYLSYNGILMISKSTDKHSMTGGLMYKNYGGIITAALSDSNSINPHLNPELDLDTVSASAVSVFASYGLLYEKIDFSLLLSFSYTDLIDIYSISSAGDISICYRSFFDIYANLMDVIPVLYYSDGMEYSYSPYSLIAFSKDVFQYGSVNARWSANIYAYYKNYSDQQFIHRNMAFSRSMGIEVSAGKFLLSGEFFSERIKVSAEYSVNEKVRVIGSYSGNSLLSSIKFGISYKY
jgi:hypothetical protein